MSHAYTKVRRDEDCTYFEMGYPSVQFFASFAPYPMQLLEKFFYFSALHDLRQVLSNQDLVSARPENKVGRQSEFDLETNDGQQLVQAPTSRSILCFLVCFSLLIFANARSPISKTPPFLCHSSIM